MRPKSNASPITASMSTIATDMAISTKPFSGFRSHNGARSGGTSRFSGPFAGPDRPCASCSLLCRRTRIPAQGPAEMPDLLRRAYLGVYGLLRIVPDRRGTPRPDQQNRAGGGQPDRDPLRNRKRQAERQCLLMIARELDEEPQHGTDHQIQSDDLAGSVFPSESPVEECEHQSFGARLVQLGRMQWNLERDSGERVRRGIVEPHCPRHLGLDSPAASGGEAADLANGVPH